MAKKFDKVLDRANKIIDKEESTVIIKVLFVVFLITFMVFVYSRASAKDVPLEKMEEAMIKSTDIEEMQKCNDRQLKQFIGLDAASLKEFFYYKSKEALGVEEILVVKVKNRSDLTAVQSAVESRINAQIDLFDGYGPEQVKFLKDSVIIKKGSYIFYCTGKDRDKYEEVFRDVV